MQTRFFPVSNENLRKLVADERFKINDQLLTDVDYRFKAHDKFEFFTHFHEPLAFVSQEQMKVRAAAAPRSVADTSGAELCSGQRRALSGGQQAGVVGGVSHWQSKIAKKKEHSIWLPLLSPPQQYRHNSVDHALARECDLRSLFSVHRLDRVASGVLLFAKTYEKACLAPFILFWLLSTRGLCHADPTSRRACSKRWSNAKRLKFTLHGM